MSFIDFADVKARCSIAQAAKLVGLQTTPKNADSVAKSQNALRLICRKKTKQVTIADQCVLKRATEVAGEFITSCYGPPHDYSIAACSARKICLQ